MSFSKPIAPGLGELKIRHLDPLDERLVLPNGVFVPCGKRPTGANLQSFNSLINAALDMTVDERAIPANQSTEGVILGDFMDYGISPVTKGPISSEHVNNCIVVNAVGVAKNGSTPEEQRGLYVHVNPAVLLLHNQFRDRYVARMREMQDATHQFTTDVAFLGGALHLESSEQALKTAQRWLNLVEELARLSEPLGVEPTVMRPFLRSLDTSVCLDTQNRTVIIRPSGEEGLQVPPEIFPPFVLASQARANIERLLSILHWK